jgi:hypothetical protein
MLKIFQIVDKFINSVTMYRLVLYGLIVLVFFSFVGSFTGNLSYSIESLVLSLIVLIVVCFVSNIIFSKLFNVFYNFESSFITALILFLILLPITNSEEGLTVVFAGLLAMGSKYIFAYHKKHIFNPVAISIFILGVLGNTNVFWWVGSSMLLPATSIVGLFVVKKIRRGSLVFSFLISSIFILILESLLKSHSVIDTLSTIFLSWPIIFFATIMLTEPLTTPPKKNLQIIYGLIAVPIQESYKNFHTEIL